ncbi:MAG: DMT family transporter, partial [Thaumarchaeota archaeon]|nr:DMT family transporter [Nitrososphaerota archaeon]
MKANRRREADFFAVLLSGLLFGTLAIFAALLSDTGMNAITQAMWRLVISVPIFALVVVMLRAPTFKIAWRDVLLLLLQGFVLYLAAIGYIASVTMGTPANVAGFLANMQPVFTIVLAGILFRERVASLKIIAAALSIIGAGLLLGYNGLNSIHLGGLVALGSSVFFAGYIIMNGRFAASRKYNALSIVFWTLIGAMISSVLFWLVDASATFNMVSIVPVFSQQQWLLL